MNWLETKSKIDEIVSHSNTVIATIEDSNKLFDFIDSLSRESKAELYEKYKNSNGPVTGIRKEVAEGLLKGNIDRKNIMVPARILPLRRVFPINGLMPGEVKNLILFRSCVPQWKRKRSMKRLALLVI